MTYSEERLEALALSQPAVVNPGGERPYWIFEMMPVRAEDKEGRPGADRAVRFLDPGEEPPELSAGDVCLLTGRWRSGKCFKFAALEARQE